jgi:hypothetical protein
MKTSDKGLTGLQNIDESMLAALRRKNQERTRRRPNAAANAKPKVKYITYGGHSLFMTDPFDGRTALAAEYRRQVQALRAHVGAHGTHPQRELIDQAARFALLARIAWGAVMREGLTIDGELTPAFVALVRVSKEQREALQLIGLERREKRAESVDDYLQGKVAAPKELVP